MGLAEVEAPGDGSGHIIQAVTLLVVDGEQAVRLVSAADIDLEGSYQRNGELMVKAVYDLECTDRVGRGGHHGRRRQGERQRRYNESQ